MTLITLSTDQQTEKEQLEAVIGSGIKTFKEVGDALTEIWAKKLYADEFKTFEEYAKEKWQFGKSRAYQMMDAAKVANNVSTIVEIPNEAVARELSPLPKSTQVEVAKKLYASPKPITAERVREVIAEIVPAAEQNEMALNEKPNLSPIAKAKASALISEWWTANREKLLGYPATPSELIVQKIIGLFN